MEHVRLQALKKLCELLEKETGYKVYRGRQVIGHLPRMKVRFW